MGFHSVRFPLDIALGAHGGPERKTDIVTLRSGHEERNSRWQGSRRRYNASYGVKSRADMYQILSFFEERRGRFHAFLWRDALDYSSNGGDGAPSPLDQTIGSGDGATTDFQLVKRYGGGFDPYDRLITKPDAASVRIAVDGAELDAGDFTVDSVTGIVSLAPVPSAGQTIAAGFEFDVPVRFDTDRLDVDLTSFDAADVPNIPLVEVFE